MEPVAGLPEPWCCGSFAIDRSFAIECVKLGGIKDAHQKGGIHRDLKPSNILITLHDGEPIPKVIDFGIAKAMDQSLTQKTLLLVLGSACLFELKKRIGIG